MRRVNQREGFCGFALRVERGFESEKWQRSHFHVSASSSAVAKMNSESPLLSSLLSSASLGAEGKLLSPLSSAFSRLPSPALWEASRASSLSPSPSLEEEGLHNETPSLLPSLPSTPRPRCPSPPIQNYSTPTKPASKSIMRPKNFRRGGWVGALAELDARLVGPVDELGYQDRPTQRAT